MIILTLKGRAIRYKDRLRGLELACGGRLRKSSPKLQLQGIEDQINFLTFIMIKEALTLKGRAIRYKDRLRGLELACGGRLRKSSPKLQLQGIEDRINFLTFIMIKEALTLKGRAIKYKDHLRGLFLSLTFGQALYY